MMNNINLTPLQYLDSKAIIFSDLGYSSVRFWFPSVDGAAMVCKRLYVDGKVMAHIPDKRLNISKSPYTRKMFETRQVEEFDYRRDINVIGEDRYRQILGKDNINIWVEAPLISPMSDNVRGMACLIPRDQTKTITDEDKSIISKVFKDLSLNYDYIDSNYQLKQNYDLLNKLNDIDNNILNEIRKISTITPWKTAEIYKIINNFLRIITNAESVDLQLLRNSTLVSVSYIGEIPISDLVLDINNRSHQSIINVAAIINKTPQYHIGKINYQEVSNIYDNHFVFPERSKEYLCSFRSLAALPIKVRSKIRGVLFIGSKSYDYLNEYNRIAIKYFVSKLELILNIEDRFLELKNEINEQIEQSNNLRITIEQKMRSNVKASIARNMMHEMGNRMAEFRLTWNSLARIIKNEQKTVTMSEHIEQILEDVMEIVSSYRKLNENTFGKKGDEIINICEAIEKAYQLCHMQATSKKIHIDLKLRDRKTNIKGWKIEIIIVVFNLLQNAIDAMSIGDNQFHGGRIIVKGEKYNDNYTMSVSDEGCGIKPELKSKIFKPDFSTKVQYGGSGTGLSLTEHIVKKNGGTIQLASTAIGKGSTFKVTIPVFQD